MKVKYVLQAGVSRDTALVLLGWLSFGLGMVMPDPIVRIILMAIARVLPKALYGYLQLT